MRRVNGIPILGFGTYPLSSDEADRAIATALELGFHHIDTAQMYGNEAEVGRALARSGIARKELYIVTKVDPGNVGADRFLSSVERSLAHLNGAVDLLLIHWPPSDRQFDKAVDLLVEAKERGFTAAIGVSNFTIAMMKRAQARAASALIANQVEFHPLIDQARVREEAEKLGMALMAYCPLGRGEVMKNKVIQEIGYRLKRPASEVALAWIMQQDVVAIPMTTKRENAQSNLRALDLVLSQADMDAITQVSKGNRRLISPAGWAPKWDN
ncbi:MAG: aldo/keto reductase [Rhizobiales bacterium]|nr:aldo/keto reductase [Hyphomicrobiales bacterium]